MAYKFWNYARRIDGDSLGIYHEDLTQMLKIDKGTASTTKLFGANGADQHLWLLANAVDNTATQCQIRLQGNDGFFLSVPVNTSFDFWTHESAKMLSIKDYSLFIKEKAAASPPTAQATYGTLWVADDDTLRYIDGAGVAHTIAYV